jgi:hypothetical protein
MNRRQFTAFFVAVCCIGAFPYFADGQTIRRNPPAGNSPVDKTTVSLVLITSDNTAALRARLWQTTLQKLDVPFRIRSATVADKVEVRERKLGPLRQVTVVGKVDRGGRLVFADRTYTRSDAAKLGEWLRELKAYGKQGKPEGKPLWGMTKAQFGVVFADLSASVATDVRGKELEQAVARLGLPSKYAVRYSVAAKAAVRKVPRDLKRSLGTGKRSLGSIPVRKSVKGQSLGTAFALVLRDYGLGFRPLRNPAGDIELIVDPLADAKDAWPIGWKLKQARFNTSPKLFKIRPVSLDKVKMLDVFHTITAKTGVPVHVDYYATAAKGIDVDHLVVSYPARKASYSLLLRGITTRKKLSYILRVDEAGQPFAWITAWTPGGREE